MMLEEIRRIKTGPGECRRFAWTIGPVLLLLGGWLWWKQAPAGPWLLGAGSLVLGIGLLSPAWLKWPWLAWMTVGLVLGTLMSAVVLTLFFYLILTPVGWMARLSGKDFLELRKRTEADSYWRPRKEAPSRERYERQF